MKTALWVLRNASIRFLACWLVLLGLSPSARAQVTETVLHNFNAYADGATPSGPMIQAPDGDYYGVTAAGGLSGDGTVYRYSPSAQSVLTIHSFYGPDGLNPGGSLVLGRDGYLYGITVKGGTNNVGAVFQMSTDGATFNTIYSFSNSGGYFPSGGMIQGADGNLYGVTSFGGASGLGTIYQLSTDGKVFHNLHSMATADGTYPIAGLVQGSDGTLYGTGQDGGAFGWGTVFRLGTNGSNFKVLHNMSIGTDGATSSATLVMGKDGSLYGETSSEVYRISTDGSTFSKVYGFSTTGDGQVPSGLSQGSDGYLYGTTELGGANQYGTVFQLSTDGTVFHSLHSFTGADGFYPYAGVMVGTDGRLHGTTSSGPTHQLRGIGTIFSLSTSGTGFSTDFEFDNGVLDGWTPDYGTLLLGADGNFYGTTQSGGVFNGGVLYRATLSGAISVLYHFGNLVTLDPAAPYGGVVADSKGNLYGATYGGGIYGQGTIYRFNQTTGIMTILYNCGEAGGSNPVGSLILAGNALYGTCEYGGQANLGIVFRLTLPTSKQPAAFQILHSFSGPDGAQPFGAMVMATDKNLYGTTLHGAQGLSNGVVFKISANGGNFHVIHAFSNADGICPYSGLIQGSDGYLYGVTSQGAVNFFGGVFRINTTGKSFTVIHSFAQSDGFGTYGSLLQASDGLLYAAAQFDGKSNDGTVYQLSTDGTIFNVLHNFTGSLLDGSEPGSGLAEGPDGNLYGTTRYGGDLPEYEINTSGTLYRIQTSLPIISSFSPVKGNVGTTVTVNGANLVGAAVTLNGVAQTVTSNTGAMLQFNVATGTMTGLIKVTVTTGTTASSAPFTVLP